MLIGLFQIGSSPYLNLSIQLLLHSKLAMCSFAMARRGLPTGCVTLCALLIHLVNELYRRFVDIVKELAKGTVVSLETRILSSRKMLWATHTYFERRIPGLMYFATKASKMLVGILV